MRGTRPRTISALIALATFTSVISGTLMGTARAATPSCAPVGCWTKPFSPGASQSQPLGKYSAQPPQTVAQSEEYPAAASLVMMPNGRIVYWNGLQNLEGCGNAPGPLNYSSCTGNAHSQVLDLTLGSPYFYTNIPTAAGNHDDLFCSDQRLLENGTVLDTGGTNWVTEEPKGGTGVPGYGGLTELYGSKNTRVFNPNAQGQGWNIVGQMHDGRWYPTMLTLPNGDQFVAGGVTKLLWNSSIMTQAEAAIGNKQYEEATFPVPENTQTTETWSLSKSKWTLNPAKDNVELPLFGRLHLLPDGEIFFSSNGQMWGPAGESINELKWNNMLLFDPSKIRKVTDLGWRTAGMLTFGSTSGAAEVMMPIDAANPDTVKVLVAGGALGPSPDSYLANNLSQMITLTKSASGWNTSVAMTGNLNNRRWFSSSVVLPNGQVVVFNGGDKDEVVLPGSEMPVHQAELFDPKTNTWTPLASSARDRTYHNTAILLPDGSVLVGGHAPVNQGYGGTGNALPLDTAGFVHNLKDPSFERFYPPYLFTDHGIRPVISDASGHTTWGQNLQVTVTTGKDSVDHFVLTRLPSQTHITDADARTIILGRGTWNGETATLQIPGVTKTRNGKAILPPGFYYLFAVNGDGVPSVAPIVQIAAPKYYSTPATTHPVELADQMGILRNASQSVVALTQQAPAAHPAGKASSARTAGTIATLDDTVIPVSKPSSPARAPRAWLYVAAALMGGALIRPIRRFARR